MIPPVGGLGGLSVGSLQAPAEAQPAHAAGGEGGFAGALGHALSSLEASQQSAAGAAQGLATGTVRNPETAVVTVEQAQLEMQLASQIRAKATESLQQIFQTQV